MTDTICLFKRKLESEWLPDFCDAPHRNYSWDGFKYSSINKLHELDAFWFMQAISNNLVSVIDGKYIAPRSSTSEQIFWEGKKSISPRPITLWLEPVITIGALARLAQEFGWPVENLGTQSKTWAFDLVTYRNDSDDEWIACEVKKSTYEIEKLLLYMKQFSQVKPLEKEPENSMQRNAYRKIKAIRDSWPQYFWALGPGGAGYTFKISKENNSGVFRLQPVVEDSLKFSP